MPIPIEAARLAVALRVKLDEVDRQLAARFAENPQPHINLLVLQRGQSTTTEWSRWNFSATEREALLEMRRRRLMADRHLILAEAAERGFAIEDAPPAETAAS